MKTRVPELTIGPHVSKFRISADPLGNRDTSQGRLQAEVASSRTVVPWLSMVELRRAASHPSPTSSG